MFLRIEDLSPKLLVGKSMKMSIAGDQTPTLWRSFMQERKSITNAVSTDLISMQVYDEQFDAAGVDPQRDFTKWAVAEVTSLEQVPNGMEPFQLSGGLYAVFLHKGPPSAFSQTFGYIYGQWLPASEYTIDHRPHFELLGSKYENNAPDSEEEIWIPIKNK